MGLPGLGRFVAVADQSLHRRTAIFRPAEHVEQHAVRDLEAGREPLRRCSHETGEGLLVPVDEVSFGRLALHNLLAVARGLLRQLEVFDDVLGGLRDHPAEMVEALAPRASADLVEIPRAENAGLLPVELAQLGEQHRADGDVDAHAQRVRAADDLEQAALGELLDEHAILRQQARVMQTDAVPQPLLDVGTVGTAELEAFHRAAQRRLFLAGADVEAGEILRALGRFKLGEVDHIDRGLAIGQQRFKRLGQRQFGIGVLQRHGPVRGDDGGRRPAREPRELLGEERRVTQRGRHQEEARLRQREQGNLPRHAALPVRVVVELVHHDVPDTGARALAQGDVREDFCGAAQDGRVVVHRRIAGAQADVVRAELTAERHELLVHQRLDRTGVNRAATSGQSLEMQGRGHERFPGTGRRVQDDILVLEQFQDGLLLRGVKLKPPARDIIQKPSQQHIAAEVVSSRELVVKGHGHRQGKSGQQPDPVGSKATSS